MAANAQTSPRSADVTRLPALHDRRRRLLVAAERLTCERGAENVTVDAVCAAARASRSTFYAVFADRTDCLLAVFDDVTEQLGAAMLVAYRSEACWVDGVRRALFELLDKMERHPAMARFLLRGSLVGDLPMLTRRERVLDRLSRALEAGRPGPDLESSPAPFGAQAVVGSLAAIVHGRLLAEPAPRLRELCGSLMGVVVLPYLGVVAAREELSRPTCPPTRRGSVDVDCSCATTGPAHPAVTKRTLRVLQAIAQSPDIGNHAVAAAAGIGDQSQVTRLLARLRRLGLIVGDERPAGRGGRKQWRLTGAGHELLAGLDPAPVASAGEPVRRASA